MSSDLSWAGREPPCRAATFFKRERLSCHATKKKKGLIFDFALSEKKERSIRLDSGKKVHPLHLVPRPEEKGGKVGVTGK